MNFLEKATDKLNITDQIPSQLRDKLPGESSKRGEGGHLNQAKQSNEDGEGFPKGLRPSE